MFSGSLSVDLWLSKNIGLPEIWSVRPVKRKDYISIANLELRLGAQLTLYRSIGLVCLFSCAGSFTVMYFIFKKGGKKVHIERNSC